MERQAKDGTVYQQVGPDQWTPVTRTAKDGTVYKKMGEDAWTPLENKVEKAKESNKVEPEDQRSGVEVIRDGLNVTNWPKNMMAGLQKVDEYTGAPIRKLITETVTGKELEKAPTGSEQAKMMGVTDKTYGDVYGVPTYLGGNISPADVAGVGLEMVQDPLLLAGKAAQGVKGLVKGGTEAAQVFRGKQAVNAVQSQAAGAAAEGSSKAKALISGGDLAVEQRGKLFDVKAPQSLDELKAWKPQAAPGEALGQKRLQQIESTVPDLQTKPLKYHYDMMENPKAMKELKLKFENLPTKDAKQIAAYNQQIVNESADKIKQTVNDISGFEPRNMTDAGYDFISSTKEKYNLEKEALGPLFQEIQKRAGKLGNVGSRDLAIAIGENSKIGKLLSQDEATGKLFLKKNAPRSGLADQEHRILSSVIDDLNDGMTFEEIQRTRDYLRKAIDPANPGASQEIEKVRSVMLGQLENMASQYGPDVGQTFKAYAINERARENIEKIIGGRVESLDAMYAANPDNVVKKIFSNPNHVKVVGEYVGPEKMREMVASYLQTGVNKAFDSAKGFEPHKLKSWLKANDKFLNANLDPAVIERLNALADYGYYGKRFLDEVNPSGTAASLIEALKPGDFVQSVRQKGVMGAVESEVAGRVHAATKQRQAVTAVNEMLGTTKPSAMSRLKLNIPDSSNVSKVINDATQFQRVGATARGTIRDVTPIRSAEKDKPTKGPEKWANDGIEMILKSNEAGIDRTTLEKLKSTQKGKELLFEASTAKNKKAMENVIKKIRTATNGAD